MANIFFLILLAYIFIFSYKNFIRGGFFLLNFNSIFTIGFVYYLIIPYYFFVFASNQYVISTFSGVNNYAVSISENNKILYLLSIFLFYASMTYFSKRHLQNINIENIIGAEYSNSNFLKFCYFIIATICVYFVFKFRNHIGIGYTDANFEVQQKGSFISFSLLLYILSFLIKNPKDSVFNKYTLLYFIFAFIIMTMGGRIYFITTIFCILIFRTHYYKSIKIKNMIMILLTAGFLFSIVGIVRMHGNISLDSIFFTFFAEPIFTSYSLFSCLEGNELPIINFPYDIIFSAYNLIPSFIIPNKKDILDVAIKMSGLNYVSPLGARSVFTSLMINFGILGIPFFSYVISLYLKMIKKININLYFFTTSCFLFIFFRDPFYISIIKLLFEFGFIIPFILLILNKYFSK